MSLNIWTYCRRFHLANKYYFITEVENEKVDELISLLILVEQIWNHNYLSKIDQMKNMFSGLLILHLFWTYFILKAAYKVKKLKFWNIYWFSNFGIDPFKVQNPFKFLKMVIHATLKSILSNSCLASLKLI